MELKLTLLLLGFSALSSGLLHGYGEFNTLRMYGRNRVQYPNPPGASEHWFGQKLDHFNPADNRYWQQRYYINDTYYKPGGPAFLFAGVQGQLTEEIAWTGAWIEYAKEYNAIGYAVEHRYYGKSQPLLNLSTPNLRYLTVEQALEDLATFITTTNKERNFTDTKWIAFGASYTGNLAAWLRYKFPHLVSGAVASIAFPPSKPIDIPVTTGEILRTVPGCYDAMRSTFDDIRDKLDTDTGAKNLSDLFGFCHFYTSEQLDVDNVMLQLFYEALRSLGYTNNSQNSIPLCDTMADETRGQPLERFADFVHMRDKDPNYSGISCSKIVPDFMYRPGRPFNLSSILSGMTYLVNSELHAVPGCYEAVSLAFDDARNKVKSDTGSKHIRDRFRLCEFDSHDKKMSGDYLLFNLFSRVLKKAHYSDYQSNIRALCSFMTGPTKGQPLERLADFDNFREDNYTAERHLTSCVSVSFEDVVSRGRRELVPIYDTERQMQYQQCTQTGFIYTTDSNDQPFGNAIKDSYFYKVCDGYFGNEFNESLLSRGKEEIEMNYGGLGIMATNVVYTHYGLRLSNDTIKNSHVTILDLGLGSDSMPSSPLDSPAVKKARVKIQEFIGQWISSRETTTPDETSTYQSQSSTYQSQSSDTGSSMLRNWDIMLIYLTCLSQLVKLGRLFGFLI